MKNTFFISSCSLIFFLAVFLHLQNPGQSMSEEETTAPGSIQNAMSEKSSGKAVIGQIRTKDKVLIIRSGADGPLYTVKSREGNFLAADINAEELNEKYPELKEIAEKGLAGNDASLRMNNKVDIKMQTPDGLNK